MAVDGGPERAHQVGGQRIPGGFSDPDVERGIQAVEVGCGNVRVIHLVQDQFQVLVVLIRGPDCGFLATPGLQRDPGFEYIGLVELSQRELEF